MANGNERAQAAQLNVVRRMAFNDLKPLPPEVDVESKSVLRRVADAREALAELRTASTLLPNESILIRAMVLQEAKVSSEIENIVTTNDELYRALSDTTDKSDPATKEVLQYEKGLWKGYQILQETGRFDLDLFLEIGTAVKQSPMQLRRGPGTKIVNQATGAVIYTPPDNEDVIRELLANLAESLNSEDEVSPLVKMALAHYQFEAIHPFKDGNGRTGRIINILYLVQCGLLNSPVLYLSKYVIDRKSEYYNLLRGVTEERDWESFILFMLDGVTETAMETTRKIQLMTAARDTATEFARATMKKGYSKELLELVFEQPYLRIQMVEDAGFAKRETASVYLRELVRIGVLEMEKRGREAIFINRRLMDAIT